MSDPWADVREKAKRNWQDAPYPLAQARTDFDKLQRDADTLLAVVRELGDGGDLESAADLLQEATNEHGVNQTFDNNPYDLSDRLRLFAKALAALPEHLR